MKKPNVIIVVKESCGIKKYRAISELPYTSGLSYRYKNYLDQHEVVYVPTEYNYPIRNGMAYVGKIAGNNSAAPIYLELQIGEPVWPSCPGSDLSTLISEDIFARAGKSLVGKKEIPWIIIFIIVSVLALVMFFMYNQNKVSSVKTVNTPVITQTKVT